MTMFEDSEL